MLVLPVLITRPFVKAKGEYVLLLNPDTVLPEQTLEKALRLWTRILASELLV